MENLRTDFLDDVLNTSENTRRKFRMITNDDGTISFEDVTAYSQVGDSFGAADVNKITGAVNELNERLTLSTADILLDNIKDVEAHSINLEGYKKVVVRVVFPSASYEDLEFDVQVIKVQGGMNKTAKNSFNPHTSELYGTAQIFLGTLLCQMQYVAKGSMVGDVYYTVMGIK